MPFRSPPRRCPQPSGRGPGYRRSGVCSRRGVIAQWGLLTGQLVVTILVGHRENPQIRRPRPHEALAGHARVIDGDTLVIGGTKVRLDGIDAPESQQTCTRGKQPWPCGVAATSRLVELIGGQQVVCEGVGQDRYHRRLAFCSAGTRELNREMVRSGLAVASGRFGAEELDARRGARGVWSGAFEHPSAWRRRHERAAAPELRRG